MTGKVGGHPPGSAPTLPRPDALSDAGAAQHTGFAAADYAAAGALVLPLHTPTPDGGCSCRSPRCAHPGKHPRTLHGLEDATADPEQVGVWWGMWPEANIGIRPHPGHIVLDVDPRHGGDVQLATMQDRYGRLPSPAPPQPVAEIHLWFAFDGDPVGQLADGIDVKSATGYVVAPPSLHISGRRYEWLATGPITPAPGYLVPLLTRPVRVATGGGPGRMTKVGWPGWCGWSPGRRSGSATDGSTGPVAGCTRPGATSGR